MAKSSEPIRLYDGVDDILDISPDEILDFSTRTIPGATPDRTVPLALPAFVSPSWSLKDFLEKEEQICEEIAAQHGQGAASDGE